MMVSIGFSAPFPRCLRSVTVRHLVRVDPGCFEATGVAFIPIRAIERMLFRALKTMPRLMGSNEATSETHANRQ